MAEQEKSVIGYLKINFGNVQTDIKDYNAMELERIYIRKGFHGKKIGKRMLQFVIAIAKE